MKIFCGEKEINYNRADKYAFLNWRFDDTMGSNNKDNPLQKINDNFEMGKGYMANAVLGLYAILNNMNPSSMADTFIFPLLFNTWHGIELWLKTSIYAIYLKTNNESILESNHDIYKYMEILKKELYKIDMMQTVEIALAEVEELIKEFKRVGAHFDFARYSFDRKGEYQFYNAPFGDDKQWQKNVSMKEKQTVPNTCVDLYELWKVLIGATVNFKSLVEYLELILTEGGELTDEAYEHHLMMCNKYENKLKDRIDEEDSMKKILKLINLYIL